MRTHQGDFQFSSLWFKQTSRFVAWCHKSMIGFREGTADQIMDAVSPDSREPSVAERRVRVFGRTLGGLLVVIMFGSVGVFAFGGAENRWLAAKVFVVAGAVLAGIPLLARYRRVE